MWVAAPTLSTYDPLYRIDASDDGGHSNVVWTSEPWPSNGQELIAYPTFFFSGRYINFVARDLGQGSARVRIYDIEVRDVP